MKMMASEFMANVSVTQIGWGVGCADIGQEMITIIWDHNRIFLKNGISTKVYASCRTIFVQFTHGT